MLLLNQEQSDWALRSMTLILTRKLKPGLHSVSLSFNVIGISTV